MRRACSDWRCLGTILVLRAGLITDTECHPSAGVGRGRRRPRCLHLSRQNHSSTVARCLTHCTVLAATGRTGRRRCAVGISCMRRKSTSGAPRDRLGAAPGICLFVLRTVPRTPTLPRFSPRSPSVTQCQVILLLSPSPCAICVIIHSSVETCRCGARLPLSTTMRTRARRSRVAFRTVDKLRRLYLRPFWGRGFRT